MTLPVIFFIIWNFSYQTHTNLKCNLIFLLTIYTIAIIELTDEILLQFMIQIYLCVTDFLLVNNGKPLAFSDFPISSVCFVRTWNWKDHHTEIGNACRLKLKFELAKLTRCIKCKVLAWLNEWNAILEPPSQKSISNKSQSSSTTSNTYRYVGLVPHSQWKINTILMLSTSLRAEIKSSKRWKYWTEKPCHCT